MKKTIALLAFILTLFTVVTLSGCADNSALPIEQMTWDMTLVQNVDGDAVYCSEQSKISHPDATVKSISCAFDGAKFTITDNETEQTWIGSYTEINSGIKKTTNYEVTFDGSIDTTKGTMVSSITEYNDKSQIGTIIFSYGDYTVTFFSELID